MALNPPIKSHGGKYYLWRWLDQHAPPANTYSRFFEGCVRGGSYILNRNPSKFECINDIDPNVCSLWLAIRDNLVPLIFELCSLQYSEETFNNALNDKLKLKYKCNSIIYQAIREFVLCNMSRGGLKKSFGWSERLRGGQPGDLNAWENKLKNLPKISQRAQKFFIYNKDIVKILLGFGKDTFIYLDPPYLPETRQVKKAYGEHEMSPEQHELLLKNCLISPSKILLSGYQSDMYMDMLKGWNFVTKSIVNHSSQSKKKKMKMECLWFNYDCTK